MCFDIKDWNRVQNEGEEDCMSYLSIQAVAVVVHVCDFSQQPSEGQFYSFAEEERDCKLNSKVINALRLSFSSQADDTAENYFPLL